jgi:hypothetical protein
VLELTQKESLEMDHIVKRIASGAQAGSVALALLLILGAWPAQAEIYKWVDEGGQVNYSQNPPPDPKKQETETIRLAPAPVSAPAPATPEGARSCGFITLPGKMLDPVSNIALWRQAIAVWQKYIDEKAADGDDAVKRGIADRRCAIAHAKGELQALSQTEQNLNNNYERVRDELAELEQRLAQCGEPQEEDEERSTAVCQAEHQPRITQLKTMLRVLEGQKKMIDAGE